VRILIIQERGRHVANQEFREALCFHRGFKKLGVDSVVAGLNYPQTQEFIDAGNWLEYSNKFDAVLLLENYDQTGWVPDLSQSKALKMFWSIDSHCNIQEHLNTEGKQKIDVLFGAIESDLPRFNAPHKFYLPNAYDDEMIYHLPGIQKQVQMGFCGNPGSSERHHYVKALQAQVGLKFDNFVIGKAMVEAINSYRFHFNRNLKNDVNYRTFETLGCGTFLFTNHTENLGNLLTDGKHLVTYKDVPDLVEKFNYYSNNMPEYNQICNAGHEFVKAHHTYRHRSARILEIIKEIL